MRFGAMNFPVLPVLQEIDAFGKMQMDYLELAMDSPMAHHSVLNEQQSDIRKALKSWKMGLLCHLPTFVYMAHLTESIRRVSIQEVLDALETARDLGAQKVVVHPGYIDGLGVHVMDHALDLAMAALDQVRQHARRMGVILCVENMFPGIGPFCTPDDFVPVFDAFPEIKLVLDMGHANIGDSSGRRIVDFIERFGDRLGHLHISDNNGHKDQHLPIGHGGIDFEVAARALGAAGYKDTVTLEIFAQDRSELIKSRQKLERLFSA